MCRLLAYIGPDKRIADLVIHPAHSLLEQSQHAAEAKFATNGDGFGLAWYGPDPHPGRFRDINPAWSDSNLPDLCRMIHAPIFLAHVRASTSGATSRANCHPFAMGPISFMHNGQLGGYPANRRVLENHLDDTHYAQRLGTADSELMFLLMMQNGLAVDPVAAIQKTLLQIGEQSPPHCVNRMTCAFSDGTRVYAFRYATDNKAPTLYFHNDTNGGLTLASEPLDSDIRQWRSVPQGMLLTATNHTSAPELVDLGLGQFNPETCSSGV